MVSLTVSLLERISSSIISNYSSQSLISTLSFWIWSLCNFSIPLLMSFSIQSCLVGNCRQGSYQIFIASCFYEIFRQIYFSSSSYWRSYYIFFSARLAQELPSLKMSVSKSSASSFTFSFVSLGYSAGFFDQFFSNLIELPNSFLSSSELFLRLDSGITPEMLSVLSKLTCGKFSWFSGQYFLSMASLKLLGSSEMRRLTDSIIPIFENFSLISWFPRLRLISESIDLEPVLFWGMIQLVTISFRLIAQLSTNYSSPFSCTLYALHWYITLFCEKSRKCMIFSRDFRGYLLPFGQAGMIWATLPITWYSTWCHGYFSKNKTRSCC